MRKRLIALTMASLMAVMPVNGVMAEEVLLAETDGVVMEAGAPGEVIEEDGSEEILIDASDEGIISDTTGTEQEISSPNAERNADVSDEAVFSAEDDILLGIEEVDASEIPLETEACGELLQTVEEQVQESGYASCAAMPKSRAYFSGVYTDSYGAQLSGNARSVYDAIKAAYVDSRNAVADGSTLTIALASPLVFQDEDGLAVAQVSMRRIMQSAYDAFIYDFPEVFWMGAPGYSYTYTSNYYPSSVAKITLKPSMIYEGAGSEVSAFDSAVDAAFAEAMNGKGTSALDKVTAIHDYLCELLSYDEGTTDLSKAYAHSAAGVFLSDTKNVVCEGYAKAFKLLCKEAGIESALIVGYANGPHMWNYVKMDNGNWYMVDVTWDDREDNSPDTRYLLVGSSSIGYSNTTIAAERTLYSKFTDSTNSPSFAVPILSPVEYAREVGSGHRHTWKTETRDATCTMEGFNISTCGCGAVSVRYFEATGHSFAERTYVYNNDATCTNDGTKMLVCDCCGTAANTDIAPGIPASLYRVQAEGTAKGHRFTNYVSNGDATWYKDGTRTAVCANGCGSKNTVTDSGSAKVPTISLNTTSIVLKKGQCTTAVKVSNLAAGDKVVGWKSANTKLVKVNRKTGKITAQKKTGTTQITVTLLSGLSKSITVKVQSSTVRTTKISGVSKKLTIQRGKKAKLAPVLKPITSQEKITYSSSNKKVATVSAKGVITAKASGKAKITVNSGSKKVTVTVTVPKITAKKITGISQAVTLKRGRSKTLKPKLSPAGSADKIRYSSSNKSVASVSAKGKVTARKKGTAVITVKAGKAVAKCKITVK